MNPNLKIFFKRAVFTLAGGAILFALYFTITHVIEIDSSKIGEYFMDGFLAFMVTLMFGLMGGIIVRLVWTGIMNRVDSIKMCCPDKIQAGVHIVASHYHAGGESTEGFNSYFHYYLDEHGKLFLSKKVEKDGADISKSILHLSKQTGLSLEPDTGKSIGIGSNTDGENTPTEAMIKLKKGKLHFRGYEGLIDYGFKVTYESNGRIAWKIRI